MLKASRRCGIELDCGIVLGSCERGGEGDEGDKGEASEVIEEVDGDRTVAE